MLDQVPDQDAGAVFRSFVRGHVREPVCRVMSEEVSLLCGTKHHATGGEHFRSGNSPGRIQIAGKREEAIRPRVRRRKSERCSAEVHLQRYQ